MAIRNENGKRTDYGNCVLFLLNIIGCLQELLTQYLSKLFDAEESAEAAVDAREAHEGEAQQSGRDEHNSHPAHTTRNVGHLQLLAHSGKDGHSEAEADGGGKGVDHGLQEVEVLLYDEDGYAEHGTVGGDEGQEDAKCLIECGRHLLQDNLDHLHQ